MRITTIAALGLLSLGLVTPAEPAFAGVFDIAGPSANNVDTNPATNVSLVTALAGTISDLNIEFTLSNPLGAVFVGNWSLTLSHGATSVVLKPAQGSGATPLGPTIVLDDAAAAPWTANFLALSGTFKPSNPLSAFNSSDLSGTWTLSFLDTVFPNEGDNLVSWRIFGATTDVPEPATLALLGTGLLGLAAARRRKAA